MVRCCFPTSIREVRKFVQTSMDAFKCISTCKHIRVHKYTREYVTR